MADFDGIKYLETGEDFRLQDLQDGLVMIFTCQPNSEFYKKQSPLFSSKERFFEENDCNVFFLSNEEESTKKEKFLIDPERKIIDLAEELQGRGDVGENLIVLLKKGDKLEFMELKETPENEYDWAENIEIFVKNYHEQEPADNGLWKWGQVVQEDGDYLCVDCGYIEEIKKGKTFPICIVCLSGEVDGPSGPSEGYWEKV